MSNEIFELVEETKEQVIIKVTAKDPLTVAKHPYVTAQMEYVTVTRGENHTYTVVYTDGDTFSFSAGRSGYTVVSENVNRLRMKIRDFLYENHVFMEARTELNPYAASFYKFKNRWWVDFLFADTKDQGRAYFPISYSTAKELVENAFPVYNELFKGQGERITEEPNANVGTVYKVEITNER